MKLNSIVKRLQPLVPEVVSPDRKVVNTCSLWITTLTITGKHNDVDIFQGKAFLYYYRLGFLFGHVQSTLLRVQVFECTYSSWFNMLLLITLSTYLMICHSI